MLGKKFTMLLVCTNNKKQIFKIQTDVVYHKYDTCDRCHDSVPDIGCPLLRHLQAPGTCVHHLFPQVVNL